MTWWPQPATAKPEARLWRSLAQQMVQRALVTGCKHLQKVQNFRQGLLLQSMEYLLRGRLELLVAGLDLGPAFQQGRQPVGRLDQLFLRLAQLRLPHIRS